MTFAALYIPDSHVQAVIRSEPSLRNRAVALVEHEPPPYRVLALNEAARRAGAQCGMNRVEVAGIPSLEVRHRSQAAEASAQAALLDLAQSFSPRFEHVAPDTVVLDLAGLENLLGAAKKIAQRLDRQAQELELAANVALAANPDAARIAARGFAGITLIRAGEGAERLGKLPVETLDLAPDMQETLARWGIRTFAALAALPAAELSERLGQEGIRLQTLARGGSLRALVPAEEPLYFEEAMDLEDPVAELEPLAFILGRLLNQLCARLSARGRATQELRLVVGVEDLGAAETGHAEDQKIKSQKSKSEKSGDSKFPSSSEEGVRGWCQINNTGHHPGLRPPLLARGGEFFTPRAPRFESRTLRLPVPMRDSRLLLKLWMLELEAHPPSAPVLKLAITAEPTRPQVAQGDLFLPRAPDPQKLELTLARLRGVVGEGKAGSPELLDTHRPDAFRMVPFGQSKLEAENSKLDFRTTLRLFRPPIEAGVEMQNGRPVRLDSYRVRGPIVSAAGPWRTSGGWWTDNPWEHDEWDIEIAVVTHQSSVLSHQFSVISSQSSAISSPRSGSGTEKLRSKLKSERLYRVYCDLKNGKWFVSGLYD